MYIIYYHNNYVQIIFIERVHIDIIVFLLFWWSTFIQSSNVYRVFTYNHMALMSLRSRSRVKAAMVLTIADYLVIHNYIRSLLVFDIEVTFIIRYLYPRLDKYL